MANRFGAAAWLFMNSASHRHLLLSDLEWLLVPALQLEQCRIIRSEGLPVAYAAWAYVSQEVFDELEAGRSRLRVADWQSGPIAVVIDLAAPFGGADRVLGALNREVFKGTTHFVMTTEPETGKRVMRRAGNGAKAGP